MQAQVLTAPGATRVNESTCDIHDVTRVASDLVAFGCTLGATQFFDSFMQIQFNSIVSSYANEIVAAVDEGIINAQEALREISLEYAELSSKALFYAQNGVGVLAGVMQVQTGTSLLKNSRGINFLAGGAYIAHGSNNIYEGLGNIYNGPQAPGVVGPIRKGYQTINGDVSKGNITYYSTDLALSIYGVLRTVRKKKSIEFFHIDPLNYEYAYKQTGMLSLVFEGLIDAITIKSINDELSLKNEFPIKQDIEDK